MDKLTYTQHTVAWPTLRLPEPWHTDEISLVNDETGSEIKWVFMRFDNGSRGVQMCVFGDGLKVLVDPRTQKAIALWRETPNPDEVTPNDLIALLEAVGAEPSIYHLRKG